MNWGGFALTLLAAVILQTTLVAFLPPPRLDLLLILALWVGLRAPLHDARLAALACGFAQGLTTADSIGAHVFAFGVTGWLLTLLREALNMRSVPGRFIALLAAAAGGQAVLRLYQRFTGVNLGPLSEVLLIVLVAAGIAAAIVTTADVIRQVRRRRYARR